MDIGRSVIFFGGKDNMLEFFFFWLCLITPLL